MKFLEMVSIDAGPASFEALYYHNRYWETGGANRANDKPRLDESDGYFKHLEDM